MREELNVSSQACMGRLLSSLALMVPIILSACSEGADPIGPGGCAVPVCEALVVRAYGSTVWRVAGVRAVLYGDYL